MDDDTRTSIEKLAYAYWQERGCPIGSPEIDWVRAEQQLARETVSESYGENQNDIVVDDEGHVSSVTKGSSTGVVKSRSRATTTAL